MYCVNCGVKLGDTQKKCPLCGTVVYHPDIQRQVGSPLYPEDRFPAPRPHSFAVPIILSTLFLMPLLITLLCDLQINGAVTWSGYVMGALILSYVVLALPGWFRKPNPAALVFCDFLVLDGYLLYINHAVDGNWFWSFGFPLVSVLGLIVTAVVILIRRFPKRGLYIFGGAAVALGAFMPPLEYLINLTFHRAAFVAWSLYPLVALVLLGLMLIFLAVNSNARQALERKFFL